MRDIISLIHMQQRPILPTRLTDSTINIDLQINLLNTWTKFKVPDYYQNIFLAHLDEQEHHRAEELIKTEIKLTLQRRSPFFQLEKLDRDRKTHLMKLQQKLQRITVIENAKQLTDIVDELQQLREANLLAAEQMLKMYNIYHCSSIESADKQMEYYDTMLNNLDRDNRFLKESALAQHLQFDQGYDPFLMAQYEHVHREKLNKSSEPIKKLFNLNISYAYRLIKTKNMILELRLLAKRNGLNTVSLQSSRYTEEIRNELIFSGRRHSLKPQQMQNLSQDNFTDKIQKECVPVKLEPIQILPYTHAKSRTTVYNYRFNGHPSSAHSQFQTKQDLKFTKLINKNDSDISQHKVPSIGQGKVKKNRVYTLTEPKEIQQRPQLSPEKMKKSIYQKLNNVSNDQYKTSKVPAQIGEIYKPLRLTPIRKSKDYSAPHIKSNYLEQPLQYNQPEVKRPGPTAIGTPAPKEVPELLPQKQQKVQSAKVNNIKQYKPTYEKISDYNPITGDRYAVLQSTVKLLKYDFNPNLVVQIGKASNRLMPKSESVPEQSDDSQGLAKEHPISKYNRKNLRVQHKKKIMPAGSESQKDQSQFSSIPLKNNIKANYEKQKNNSEKQTEKNKIEKIDSECQTSQIVPPEKNVQKLEPQQKLAQMPNQRQASKQNNIPTITPINVETIADIQIKQNPNNNNKNQAIPIVNSQSKNIPKPANSQVSQQLTSKEQAVNKAVTNTKPMSQMSPSKDIALSNNNERDKKQIRMKVGKLSMQQVISIIENSEIPAAYKKTFQVEKLASWLKVSQTYLTQFYINDQRAIIGLCSPVPNIGMALKLWAPVSKLIDQNISNNLFLRYINFIQKSTSSPKIMFSGSVYYTKQDDGSVRHKQIFKQLELAQFVMKKENLFERIRKLPPKESDSQFKPLLYIQCSNIVFSQKSKEKMLYSQEIQQFSGSNFITAPFIGEANTSKIPAPLKPLTKITQNLSNFSQVNKILTDEDFDHYQASNFQTSNISLLRFYLNSPLKSMFIASQGFFQFIGTQIHQKKQELVISVPITQSNGTIYFCKNLQLSSVAKMLKLASTTRVSFNVAMFSKKLYGMMVNFNPQGCYGNWEINLTWEDEMQGRIKHNLQQGITFGPEPFKVVIELEKQLVYGFQVKQEDFIF